MATTLAIIFSVGGLQSHKLMAVDRVPRMARHFDPQKGGVSAHSISLVLAHCLHKLTPNFGMNICKRNDYRMRFSSSCRMTFQAKMKRDLLQCLL